MFENDELEYDNQIGRYFIQYYDDSTFVLDIYWNFKSPERESKRVYFILYAVDATEDAVEGMKNYVDYFNNLSIVDQRHIRYHFTSEEGRYMLADEESRKKYLKDSIEHQLGYNSIKAIKTVEELETGYESNGSARLSDNS